MKNIDEIIHQPVRLRLMAVLTSFGEEMQTTFSYLKGLLKLTDGNLGAHLHKLEEAGYVSITKTFVQNKPQTYVAVTPEGRAAFAAHVKALEAILQGEEPS